MADLLTFFTHLLWMFEQSVKPLAALET